MQQEEEVVLPLAERALTDEDWREIDAAFAGNADPLIGQDVEKDFERLFTRIVNIAPPPIGVGRDSSSVMQKARNHSREVESKTQRHE
jgi:hypothetical protein